MGIRVLKAGLLTTVQDLGRTGYKKDGIIVNGAMDTLALQIGNLLLGNDRAEAGLECTLMGPKLMFEQDQLIAVTGGDLSPMVDDVAVKMWRPLLISKGSVLSFGAAVSGCRAYISVSGGFDLPVVLGSKSTYLKAGFGGLDGHALKTNDMLLFKRSFTAEKRNFNWSLDLRLYPDLNDASIRVMEGPEHGWFNNNSLSALFAEDYEISKEADRMGYRLKGAFLKPLADRQLLSTAVTFGTVQVTGSGELILLMADHQTTGGYPRVLQVISADLAKLAQMQSGKKIRFKLVNLTEAREALLLREQQIRQLKQTITFKYL